MGDKTTEHRISPAAVAKMTLMELIDCLESLGETDQFPTRFQYQDRIFQLIHKRRQGTSGKSPPMASAKDIIDDFKEEKVTLGNLINEVSEFIYDEMLSLPFLKKLGICQTSFWMKKADFDKVKENLERQPMLLVAGSTSSGKSTFVNALLGQQVLPTSYNAATSTLCEVKYGDRKIAKVHFSKEGPTTKEYDLTDCDQTKELWRCVSHRGVADDDQATACSKAEIFWPFEFLKDFTLIDSPGVTESEGTDNAARLITEECQQSQACGYIYILDASQPAEEAAQAGGLLMAIIKSMKVRPVPGSALFVANKWDKLQEEEEIRKGAIKKYLDIVEERLSKRWRGFDRRQQLVTLNSRIAARVQELGETTEDMKEACDKMLSMLSKGMVNMLRKTSQKVYNLLAELERIVENYLRCSKMDQISRSKKIKSDKEYLEELARVTSNEAIKGEIRDKVEGLIPRLREHVSKLQHEKAWNSITDVTQKNQQEIGSASSHLLAERVKSSYLKIICDYEGYKEICRWAQCELADKVEPAVVNFNMLKSDIGGSYTADAMQLLSKLRLECDDDVCRANVLPSLKDQEYFCLDAAALQQQQFSNLFEKLHRNVVAKDCKLLKELVNALLNGTSPQVQVIQKNLPNRLDDLKHQVEAVEASGTLKGNNNEYEMILLQCQVLMGKLAKFELDLDIHIYTHNQVKQEESVGDKTGAFSVVTKVILPDKTEAALKMMQKPITNANADDFMKEFCNCSQLQDTNLVKLYGSIMLSPSPCLKLGLLFEWCGGGSLADFISRSQQQADDKRCNHERAGKTMKQILAGVKYLHARSMIHRDLKPENVMLTVNEDVRIADFATAKRQAEITGFQIVGTDIYMAPEVYDCLPYSLSSDMYSIGVMMWEIWNRKRVRDCTSYGLQQDIAQWVLKQKFDGTRGQLWQDLAKRCLSRVPTDRPSAEQACIDLVRKE